MEKEKEKKYIMVLLQIMFTTAFFVKNKLQINDKFSFIYTYI